jgi:uncharacterized protein YjbJ (UPF0337 family)
MQPPDLPEFRLRGTGARVQEIVHQHRAKELKGKIKEEAGRAMNRPDLEDKGTADQAEGKVQEIVTQIQRGFEK